MGEHYHLVPLSCRMQYCHILLVKLIKIRSKFHQKLNHFHIAVKSREMKRGELIPIFWGLIENFSQFLRSIFMSMKIIFDEFTKDIKWLYFIVKCGALNSREASHLKRKKLLGIVHILQVKLHFLSIVRYYDVKRMLLISFLWWLSERSHLTIFL